MSPITKLILAGVLLLAIGACGSSTPNSKAVYSSDKGTHPAGWLPLGHATAAKADGNSCIECHGDDLTGGIAGVSCLSCHTNGNPLTSAECASCHGKPPSGSGAGAHNTVTGHFAAAVKLPDECNTCHDGAGSGTLKHDNGAVDVALLNVYSAKSGTAAYNADGTCSSVSCHGGQTTPAWLTGSINVAAQCTSCHAYGTSEYNSFVSGEHDFHVNVEGFACSACHDATKLTTNHFTRLNTPTLEGPASATLNSSLNYVPSTFTCSPSCHGRDVWE